MSTHLPNELLKQIFYYYFIYFKNNPTNFMLSSKKFYDIASYSTQAGHIVKWYSEGMAIYASLLYHPHILSPKVIDYLINELKVYMHCDIRFYNYIGGQSRYSHIIRRLCEHIQNLYPIDKNLKSDYSTVNDHLKNIRRSKNMDEKIRSIRELTGYIDKTKYLPLALGRLDCYHSYFCKEDILIMDLSILAPDILKTIADRGFYITLNRMDLWIYRFIEHNISQGVTSKEAADGLRNLNNSQIIKIPTVLLKDALSLPVLKNYIFELFYHISDIKEIDIYKIVETYLQQPDNHLHTSFFTRYPVIKMIWKYWPDDRMSHIIRDFYDNWYSLLDINVASGSRSLQTLQDTFRKYDIFMIPVIYEETLKNFGVDNDMTKIAFDVFVVALIYGYSKPQITSSSFIEKILDPFERCVHSEHKLEERHYIIIDDIFFEKSTKAIMALRVLRKKFKGQTTTSLKRKYCCV